MQKYISPKTSSLILAVLTFVISGCVPSQRYSVITPVLNSAEIPTLQPATSTTEFLPTQTDIPQVTAAPTIERTPTVSPSPASQWADIDGYLHIVMPLADEHIVDSYQARKLDALNDEEQIETFRTRALDRLAALREIQPPGVFGEGHTQLIESFELMVSTWNSINEKDYESARTSLISSLELSAEFLSSVVLFHWEENKEWPFPKYHLTPQVTITMGP